MRAVPRPPVAPASSVRLVPTPAPSPTSAPARTPACGQTAILLTTPPPAAGQPSTTRLIHMIAPPAPGPWHSGTTPRPREVLSPAGWPHQLPPTSQRAAPPPKLLAARTLHR